MLDEQSTFITVYMSESDCFRCHCLRLVLSNKHIDYNPKLIKNIKKLPADLEYLSDKISLPVFVDRHLAIDNLLVAVEYLDERFPYPPMMPLDPALKARMRLSLIYVHQKWGDFIDQIKEAKSKPVARKVRTKLLNELLASTEMFKRNRYLSGSEFGLLDCIVSPILWRLPGLGIKLEGRATEPLRSYQKLVFDNPAFRKSMIESDEEYHTVL